MATFQTLTDRVESFPAVLYSPVKFKHWWCRAYYRIMQKWIVKTISQDVDYAKLLENARVVDRCLTDCEIVCKDIQTIVRYYGQSAITRKISAQMNRMMLRLEIMKRGGM
jgi:hypothetical protein